MAKDNSFLPEDTDFVTYYGKEYADDNIAFYNATDCYGNDIIEGFFKDEKNQWHELHFGQNLMMHSGQDYSDEQYYTDDEVKKYINQLKEESHLIDKDGHIFYKNGDNVAQDTGFTRALSGSHLDSYYAFKNSFVMDNKKDVIGDPDNDVYSKANINENVLYKRNDKGKYEVILKSDDCIFQKEGFPDNVYFMGGSWRHPEVRGYFIDGEVEKDVQLKIDELVSLGKKEQSLEILQKKSKSANNEKDLIKISITGKAQQVSEKEMSQKIRSLKTRISPKNEKTGDGKPLNTTSFDDAIKEAIDRKKLRR